MSYTFRRKSQLTGTWRDRVLDVTPEQVLRWDNGALVQDAFPDLTPGDREFIITGITEEEWDTFIATGEDDE